MKRREERKETNKKVKRPKETKLLEKDCTKRNNDEERKRNKPRSASERQHVKG